MMYTEVRSEEGAAMIYGLSALFEKASSRRSVRTTGLRAPTLQARLGLRLTTPHSPLIFDLDIVDILGTQDTADILGTQDILGMSDTKGGGTSRVIHLLARTAGGILCGIYLIWRLPGDLLTVRSLFFDNF